MADIKAIAGDVFGWMGTLMAFVFLFAPFFQIKELIQGKLDYKKMAGALLVISTLNCALWAAYAGRKYIDGDHGILQSLAANIYGTIVSTIWTIIYLVFFAEKVVWKAILFNCIFLIVLTGIILFFFIVLKDHLTFTQYFTLVVNVFMYIAPAQNIVKAIKDRDLKSLPILSIVTILFNCICWCIYGLVIIDVAVYAPNVLGIIFEIICIIAYFVIKQLRKKENLDEKEAQANAEVEMQKSQAKTEEEEKQKDSEGFL